MKKILNFFSEGNIHKIFLITAIFLGTIASVMLPIFNDPDGQYHVAVSGKIAGVNIDLSNYGEIDVGSGMDEQKDSYVNGYHLKKYYFTKYEEIDFNNLPRNFDYNVKNYVFWGHIIPAIGMKIGSLIYPSLGVVVTFARLASILVCYISIFFMIKYLKAGKLIFSAISLTPVWLNQIASLSYDASSYVVVAWFIMLVINLIYDKKITKNRNFLLLLASIFLLLVAKKNFYLLLLFLPVVYTVFPNDIKVIEKFRLNINKVMGRINSQRTVFKVIEIAVILFISLILADIGSKQYGGVIVAVKRIVRTQIFNDLNWWPDMSWLVSPYPKFNHMPIWIYGMWFAMFVLLLIYNKRFVSDLSISITAFLIFIVNILGVYYQYLGFNGAFSGYIMGVQGRYFSPLLLLFVIIVGFNKFPNVDLSNKSKSILILSLYSLIIISDGLLIFNTIYALMA